MPQYRIADLHRVRYRVRNALYASEMMLRTISHVTGSASQVAGNNTDIVIEGFPRSGNSFAVWGFLTANPGARIAHHLHAPAQIKIAARRGLPNMVPLRAPEDAVRSLLVRYPEVHPSDALRAYIRFYETAIDRLDALLIADFLEITRDFGALTDRVNQHFGTSFQRFEHTTESAKFIFDNMARVNEAAYGRLRESHIPRPSADKDAMKQKVDVHANEKLLQKANALFSTLRRHSGVTRPTQSGAAG